MPTRSLFAGAAVAVLLLSSTGLAHAQNFPEANPEALRGVTAFDAQFITAVWMDIESVDQERFRARGQSVFERGVRAAGPEVSTSAPNYLYCVVSALQQGDLIFFNYDVDYHLYQEQGIQPLEWTAGGIASIAASDFTADEAAHACAQSFSQAWQEQNPS